MVSLYLAQFFWSHFRLCESGHPACASELVLGLQNRLHPRLPETSVQQVCCMCAGIGREVGNNTSCVMNTMKNLSQYIRATAAIHHMQNSHVIQHLNMDRKVVERLTKDTISEATLKNSTAEATLTSKIHQGNKAAFFNILLLGWSIDTRRIPTTIVSGILAYRRPSTASKSNLVTASCHERLKCGWMWNSLLRMCTVSHFLHVLPHPSNFKPYAESNWSSTGVVEWWLSLLMLNDLTLKIRRRLSLSAICPPTAWLSVKMLHVTCVITAPVATLGFSWVYGSKKKHWKRPPIALWTVTNNPSVLLGPSDSQSFFWLRETPSCRIEPNMVDRELQSA